MKTKNIKIENVMKESVRKWIVDKLLPILISVILTGIMTIFITYRVAGIEENQEVEYVAYETYMDLINLRDKIELYNNSVRLTDETITLNLISSSVIE